MSRVRDRRVLVPLTYGFSVRYAVPTGLLDRLRSVCTPVVGLGWDEPELTRQLEAAGHEVVQLPVAMMSHDYRNHARRLDRLHGLRLRSRTTAIRRARWKQRGLTRRRLTEELRSLRHWMDVRRPGGAESVTRADAAMLRDHTNLDRFAEWLGQHSIDAVLSFTPYHDQDVLLLVAAHDRGSTTMVSVISFDNPTIRGRLPVSPRRVMVWNRDMADQIVRSHPGVTHDVVDVVGAPQFDLHRRADLVEDERRWRSRLQLPEGRPIILYGAGPSRLVPGEHRLVEVLDRAITEGRLPGDPFILVRRHPADRPEQWAEHERGFANALVAAPWASGHTPLRSWPSEDDLRVQMSSLAHASVHVNVCSSMTVDGAMFDRPQIGPTFVPGASRLQQRFVRQFYDQEHWAPIAESGGLVPARNPDELVAAVASALTNPDERSGQRRALLDGVLTWPDGGSVDRLVAQVAVALEP